MENQNLEWKESWRDEYVKWICGFANAHGGKLIIGKNDLAEIVGVPEAKRLSEEIPNKVRDLLGIVVDVNILEENGKQYLEIIVEPYPYPVNYKGQFHYRSGSTKQELKGNALNKFILLKTGKHWDGVPFPYLKTEDLDAFAFNLFRKKALHAKRIEEETLAVSDEMLLYHLNLIEKGQLKRAAALLYYHSPDSFFTGAYIKIGYFENNAELLYQDEIHGNLFVQVDKTMDLLFTKYLKAYVSYEGIQRIEKFPFPEHALREAILNAVAHKDYSSGVPIQIKVYADKLFIWNDGQLPFDWSIENLFAHHPSRPNNPDIANIFFRAGMIESWGRGVEKMIVQCELAGVPMPKFDIGLGGLQIEFSSTKDVFIEDKMHLPVDEHPKMKVKGKTVDKIIEIMRENDTVTIPEIATLIGITTRAVEKNIRKLQTERKIERLGSDKTGHWRIL